MTKDELTGRVAKRSGEQLRPVSRIINMLMKIIQESLVNGEEVRLTGIGVLYSRNYEDGRRRVRFRGSDVFNEELTKHPIEQ